MDELLNRRTWFITQTRGCGLDFKDYVDMNCGGCFNNALRKDHPYLGNIRNINVIVPVTPHNTKAEAIHTFVSQSRNFTSLQNLQVTVVLEHPLKFSCVGSIWRQHGQISNSIIKALRNLENITNLKSEFKLMLELPEDKAAGYEFDISGYRKDEQLEKFEEKIRKIVRQPKQIEKYLLRPRPSGKSFE